MDTLLELRTAVQDDLTVGSESTLFTTAIIDRAINRAYRKAGAYFPWPELMDAKKTVTVAGQEYYDYPQNWRSNSIWKLRVNYERFGEEPDGSPLSFDDYLNWKEDYSDSTDKKWSSQQRRFFIFPVPTVSDLLICIWGHMVTTELVDDTDITIFSYSTPEGNEAIVSEAVAILKNKVEKERTGQFRSGEAEKLLIVAWGKIQKANAKYEKNMPVFNVPDYFGKNGGNTRDLTGRF